MKHKVNIVCTLYSIFHSAYGEINRTHQFEEKRWAGYFSCLLPHVNTSQLIGNLGSGRDFLLEHIDRKLGMSPGFEKKFAFGWGRTCISWLVQDVYYLLLQSSLIDLRVRLAGEKTTCQCFQEMYWFSVLPYWNDLMLGHVLFLGVLHLCKLKRKIVMVVSVWFVFHHINQG